MNPKEQIRVQIASSQTHELLVAEVFIDDLFAFLVSQEKGSLLVEFAGADVDQSHVTRAIELNTLNNALVQASATLSASSSA